MRLDFDAASLSFSPLAEAATCVVFRFLHQTAWDQAACDRVAVRDELGLGEDIEVICRR